jgi:hypothetical protein
MAGDIRIEFQRAMAHGLAMCANGGDFRGLQSRLLAQIRDHIGVVTGDLIACQGASVQFVGATCVERQQRTSEGRIKRHKVMGQNSQVACIVYLGQHTIRAIQGCARHEANEMRRGHVSCQNQWA